MDIEEKSWTFLTKMNSKRDNVAAVEVNNKLFVAGGYNGDDELSSTEFISSEGMVTAGPDLPSPRSSHCMTKLPSGRIVFIGGYPSSNRKSVIEFDPITNSFKDLPSLATERYHLACAVFKSPFHNERMVLLAAGGRYEATAELLDYTQPNAKWTQSKINILFSTYL